MRTITRKFPLTTREVAEAAGVHQDTVLRYANNGRIPFELTSGRHRRFPQRAVDVIIAARQGNRSVA